MKVLTESPTLDWLRATAATIPADQAVVEVGTYQGGSLRYLAEGAKAGNNPKVYGIDLWGSGSVYQSRPHLRRAYGPANKVLAQRQAPDAILVTDESTHAAHVWRGGEIGLLFIDADHSYQACMGDFTAWRPHLAPGAFIAFDDYWKGRFDGVVEAVDELVNTGVLKDFRMLGTRAAATRLA